MKGKEISKYLSLVLRHQPDVLGIELDTAGWTAVDVLLAKMQAKDMQVSLDQLKQLVASNDKQRFAFSDDFTRIRANQGHSVQIALGLPAVTPPEYLYHGTAEQNLTIILQEGLKKMSRQHVHLSLDQATAQRVGQRHGKPVVLLVKSGDLHRNGGVFYLSENQVWLTDYVAPEYIEVIKKG